MKKEIPIKLTFRGVRGSCAAPFADRMEYGGNTSCVSIQIGGTWIICDAGTGILSAVDEIRQAAKDRPAEEILSGAEQEASAECCVHIFLSHLHLDHISALAMFLAALPKQIPVHIWGMSSDQFMRDGEFRSFGDTLQQIFCPPVWPVTLRNLCPQLIFHDMTEGKVEMIADGMTVVPYSIGHPDGTANFRFELDGRTIFYGLDCELTPERIPVYTKAARQADVILFDGAYTEADYEKCRGFGHSSMTLASSVLRGTEAGQLWILHYDHYYTDAFLREMEEEIGDGQQIHFTKEGKILIL